MPCICLHYVYKYTHYQLIISYIWLSFWKRENWAGWSPFYISLQNLHSRTNHRYLGIYSPSYLCYQAYGISSKGTTRTIPSVKTVAKWWLLNCGICENNLKTLNQMRIPTIIKLSSSLVVLPGYPPVFLPDKIRAALIT